MAVSRPRVTVPIALSVALVVASVAAVVLGFLSQIVFTFLDGRASSAISRAGEPI